MEFTVTSNQFEYVLLGVFLVVVIIVAVMLVADVLKMKSSMQELVSEAVAENAKAEEPMFSVERVVRPEPAPLTNAQLDKRIQRSLEQRKRSRSMGYAQQFSQLPETYASDPAVTINAGTIGLKGSWT